MCLPPAFRPDLQQTTAPGCLKSRPFPPAADWSSPRRSASTRPHSRQSALYGRWQTPVAACRACLFPASGARLCIRCCSPQSAAEPTSLLPPLRLDAFPMPRARSVFLEVCPRSRPFNCTTEILIGMPRTVVQRRVKPELRQPDQRASRTFRNRSHCRARNRHPAKIRRRPDPQSLSLCRQSFHQRNMKAVQLHARVKVLAQFFHDDGAQHRLGAADCH